jgi:hypothetical protein
LRGTATAKAQFWPGLQTMEVVNKGYLFHKKVACIRPVRKILPASYRKGEIVDNVTINHWDQKKVNFKAKIITHLKKELN